MMGPADAPSAPEILVHHHVVEAFDCGDASLNTWLRRHAMANQVSGASRTFVICRGMNVIGYYALAAGGIASSDAPSRLRRNMPDPIPLIVLGRLAVDRSEQGKNLGSFLLRDAVNRTRQIKDHAGVAGMMVHAISDQAKSFYLRWGFIECPSHPLTLVTRIKDFDTIR
jgi:GNAT superfamily N-acetyltransferase